MLPSPKTKNTALEAAYDNKNGVPKMSLNIRILEPLETSSCTTLEDLQEKGYSLSSYCKSCNDLNSLEIYYWIQTLGRAFPLYLVSTKINLFAIDQCHPETRVCCLSRSAENA